MSKNTNFVYAEVKDFVDLAKMLARKTELQNKITKLKAQRDAEVLQINEVYNPRLEPLNTELLAIDRGVAVYIFQHKNSFLNGVFGGLFKPVGEKTFITQNGEEISWTSNGNGRVRLLEKLKDVIAKIKAGRKRKALIRVVEQVDKDAVLEVFKNDPDKAKKFGMEIVKEDVLQITAGNSCSYNSDDIQAILEGLEKSKAKAKVA